MKIDVKKFSKIQDIYISPDPQEHRPAWIWFAYIDGDLAVAAGRGTASSWWNSAMISRKGQIHIDGKVYQVEFEPVIDKENIDASFENGILKVTMPKKQEEKSSKKTIEVK